MIVRPRRNRKSEIIRNLTQETQLNISDIIAPLFVLEGENQVEKISTMPGICRYTPDLLVKEVLALHKRGVKAFALFPKTEDHLKSEDGKEAFNPNALIPRTIHLLKKEVPQACIITDVALDPYTSHGHDGIANEEGEILNDETVETLVKQALVAADAGVDIIAPSDMMDGRVKAIRTALDSAGFTNTLILSYTAKYASSLYSPFRDAIATSLTFGDKLTYQMSPHNIKEALLEAKLDQDEGADMLMVKPATYYLDVISRIRQESHIPVGAYHVSGEYAMVAAAAQAGVVDKHKVLHEALVSIKRAGASFIFTYAYNEMLDIYGH